jgi:membrane protein YqaA with SNARE-associated domain
VMYFLGWYLQMAANIVPRASGQSVNSFEWAQVYLYPVFEYLRQVPLIYDWGLSRGYNILHSYEYFGVFLWSLQGIPYKIFAGIIGAEQRNILEFIAYTPLVRSPRFLLVVLLTWCLAKLYRRYIWEQYILATCIWLWVSIYIGYIYILVP